MGTSPKIQISVFIATSLDGYISRPDGSIDWLENAGELPEGEDAGFKEFFAAVDVLVMGRNSFEKVLEFGQWPYQSKPVIVLSKTLTEVPKELSGTVSIDSSLPEEIMTKLAHNGHRRVYLDGGKVIQSFLSSGFVDDLTITCVPVLIGQGRPLFGEVREDVQLRHVSTQTWDNGFVQSKYEIIK